MSDSDGLPVGNYQAAYDADVAQSLQRAMARSAWGMWFGYCARLGAQLCMTTFFALVLAGLVAGQPDQSARVFVASATGFGIGFLWAAHRWYDAYNRKDTSQVGQVWFCQVTEEAWSFESKEGLVIRIPWRIMRIRFVHPDAWLVHYGHSGVVVFRRPLREAGLEGAFFDRVPRRPDAAP